MKTTTRIALVVGMLMVGVVGAPHRADANVAAPSQPAKAPPVVVNGKALDDKAKAQAAAFFGRAPAAGEWWYDAKSGLFGAVGHGTQGVLKAGFAVAPIPRNASRGDTNILVNGREITKAERDYLIAIFNGNAQNPDQYAGSYDLDAAGNLSKTDGTRIGNVASALRAKEEAQKAANSSQSWYSKSGAAGGSAPGCSWVYIPNKTTNSSMSVTSGCD